MAVRTLEYFFIISALGFISGKYADGANLTYMENTLRNYFSKTRHHDIDQAYKDRSMLFIRDEFKRLGLETELQVYPDSRVSNTTNFTNVIGVLKGERFGSLSDRILGVGAHYDTVPTTPGVDDNGAAVVSMLEVARQLTEMNRQGLKRLNTVIFVSFDIEEEGLFGSEAFVQDWFIPYLHQNYGRGFRSLKPYGFVVMDVPMLYNPAPYSQSIIAPGGWGLEAKFANYFPTVYSHFQQNHFRGDFIALIYRNGSTDTNLAEAFRRAWPTSGEMKFKLEEFPVPVINVTTIWDKEHPILSNFLRSDHARFWFEDFPAIFLSDTANFRNKGNVCYHGSCDSIDVYVTADNMKFLGKTTDSIAMSIDLLSEPHGGRYTGYRLQDTVLRRFSCGCDGSRECIKGFPDRSAACRFPNCEGHSKVKMPLLSSESICTNEV